MVSDLEIHLPIREWCLVREVLSFVSQEGYFMAISVMLVPYKLDDNSYLLTDCLDQRYRV
jgi:hypothetical protein